MVGAKRLPLFGALVFTSFVGCGGSAMALDDPAGYWATEKHESQIKIIHCGHESICGSIFWIKEPNDAKGRPKLDRENEDESKRKEPLLGLQLINMKLDEDHWKGTIYNPQNGKTYTATFKLVSHNEAEVEGCVAYVLCGGQKWTREEPHVTAATPGTATAAKAHTPTPPAGTSATPPTQ